MYFLQFFHRLLLLYACSSVLATVDDDVLHNNRVEVEPADLLEVDLPPSEVQKAVEDAVEIVKEQIEVVEPHVFQSGKYKFFSLWPDKD